MAHPKTSACVNANLVEAVHLSSSLCKAAAIESELHSDLQAAARAAIKQIRADCKTASAELDGRKKQAIATVRSYLHRTALEKRQWSSEKLHPELEIANKLAIASPEPECEAIAVIMAKAKARLEKLEDRIGKPRILVEASTVDKPLYAVLDRIFALEIDVAPFSKPPGQSDLPFFVQATATVERGPVCAQRFEFASDVSPHAGSVLSVRISIGGDFMAIFWQVLGDIANRLDSGSLLFDTNTGRMYLCSYSHHCTRLPLLELHPEFARERNLRYGGVSYTHFSVVTAGATPKVKDIADDANLNVVSYLCSPQYDVHYQLAQERTKLPEPTGFVMFINNKPTPCYRDDGGLCEKLDQEVPMCQWTAGENSTPAWKNVVESILVMLPGRLMFFRAGETVTERNFTPVRGGTDVPIAVEPRETIKDFDHNDRPSVCTGPAPLQMCRAGDFLVILCDGMLTTRRITTDDFGLAMTRTTDIDEHLNSVAAECLCGDRILHIASINRRRFAIMTKNNVLNVSIEQDE